MAQLAPVQRPIGVFPNFIAKGTEALVIKERVFSLSGDSFDITDAQGRAVFKVEAHHISLSGRKSLSDSAGNKLFDLVKEHLHIHTTFVGEDTQKKKILEVKNSFKLMGSKANVEIYTHDGRTVTLTMSGNWRDTRADIVDTETGAVVARIDRKLLNLREIFGNQQTYTLIVAPGVDMAIMTAVCIALDEKNNEK